MDFRLEKKNYAIEGGEWPGLSPIPHMHSHLEAIFIKKDGKSNGIVDGKTYLMEENDLLIVFPNQVHYYLDVSYPMIVDVIAFSPDVCPEFKEIFKNWLPESSLLKNAGDNPLIKISIETLVNFVKSKEKDSETLARGVTLVLLSEFLKHTTLTQINARSTDLIKEIIDYCYENYMHEISLEKIAGALHVGKYHVSRVFNQQLKISFTEYINSLRIMRACELLISNEKSITEIAMSVGYNSIRSFNRCFREVKGTSPRQYQLEMLKKRGVQE